MNEQPKSYQEASDLLGKRDYVKIAHNTYLERLSLGVLGIRLHATYIVRMSPSGTVRLDTAGHLTKTTKERINRYLPERCHLFQRAGQWYLVTPEEQRKFYDGMEIAGPMFESFREQL